MGVWNSHTSLGNILGGIIAAAFLEPYYVSRGYWALSFIVPGAIIFIMGVIVLLLLVPRKSKGCKYFGRDQFLNKQ